MARLCSVRGIAYGFLLCLCVLQQVNAAQVNVPKRSVADLISNVTPILSENALGYVRAEGDYPFTYNNKAYSAGPILQTTKIPTSTVKSVLKEGLKTNAPKLLLDATIAASVAAVGWVMTDGVLMKKTEGAGGLVSTDPSAGQYSWTLTQRGSTQLSGQSSATGACSAFLATSRFTSNPDIIGVRQAGSKFVSATQYTCAYETQSKSTYNWNADSATVTRYGSSCPANSSYDSNTGGCLSTASSTSPVTDADFTSLNTQLDGLDAKHLNDVLKASCEGSLAPARCIQSLQDAASHLHSGPSTVKGPSVSSTSTTANSDGTTSTSTTKEDTNFKLGYNADGFTWTPETTKTVTGADGKTTETTTTEEDNSTKPSEEEEQEQAQPCTTNCDGPAYADLYTPTTDKKESLLDGYKAKVAGLPIVSAGSNFFNVQVSATCPVWAYQGEYDVLGNTLPIDLRFDYHCSESFTSFGPAARTCMLIVCAFMAFRIAMLD